MKKINLIAGLFLLSSSIYGQNSDYNDQLNAITTACPFLTIIPNSQSSAIGEIGVVASSEYYESGLIQNPALLSRNEKVMGAKSSYSPWLRFLVPGIDLADFGYYYSFNQTSTVGVRYNLASMGTIEMRDTSGSTFYVKPFEYAASVNAAKSLTPNFSVGLGIKYISSDLSNGNVISGHKTKVGKAIAADLGFDYRRLMVINEKEKWRYDIGASITNIGNKITYSVGNKITYSDNGSKNFLPVEMKSGLMISYINRFKENIEYTVDMAYQASKLLVPTPAFYSDSVDSNGDRLIIAGMSNDVSVAKGMIQSFYDAPGGATEELREIIYQFGIENRLKINEKILLGLRVGKFLEHRLKGGRNMTTFGIGAGYKFIYLDYGVIGFENLSDKNSPRTYSGNLTLRFRYNL